MKKKFLIVVIFLLALVSFEKVEAVYNTEYMSAFSAIVKYTPKGNFQIDSMEEEYYSQVYEVYANGVEIIDYTITELSDLPEGSFVADVTTGNRINKFDGETLKFKIMVPASEVTKDFLGKIKVHMNFYGFVHTIKSNGKIEIDKIRSENEQIKMLDNRHSSLTLNFIDKDTLEGIDGVETEIKDITFEEKKNLKSDTYGKVCIDKIGEGSAEINVKKFPSNYYLEEMQYLVEIGYNQDIQYDITLEYQKGNLRITDNIENAVFEIYDSKGELVRKIYQ